MKKNFNKKTICIVLILCTMLASSTYTAQIIEKPGTNLNEGLEESNPFSTHTVLGEECSSTTCGYCPTVMQYMKNIYHSGQYDFYYVTLVGNMNTYAYNRIVELGVSGYPTVVYDGGYTRLVGASPSQADHETAITNCENRVVANVDLDISAFWMGGGIINVEAEVTNNGGSTYNGHVHVYVTEIDSRWYNSGYQYEFAMIGDLAINQNIAVPAGSSTTVSQVWNPPFSITMNNIKVIGSVFAQSNSYTDETAATNPEYPNNDPPSKPSQPSGPSDGYVGIEYTYSTSSTEINGDSIKYGWDWDGDDVVDEWTDLYPSGQTVQASHSWQSTGTYNVQVKAKDIFGDESDFSTAKQVQISTGDPPEEPLAPTGPTEGLHKTSYVYSSSTTDPNPGDKIYYQFNWDDGSSGEWIGPYDSGETATKSHFWSEPGTYDVKVKAKDLAGSESDWSDVTTVTMGNTPPNTPAKPEGPSTGIAGLSYTYSAYVTDPQNDKVEYLFEWGDATNTGWISKPYASHKWVEPGEYGVRVKARDKWDESEWSPYRLVFIDEGSLDVNISEDLYIGIVGEEIQFNAIASGGTEPYTWTWDFGDGNFSDEQNPIHVYGDMGNYIVSLSVLDKIGAYGSDFTTVDIEVTHPPNIPTVDGQSSGITGQSRDFTFSATDPDNDDVYVMVDWGDETDGIWAGPYESGEEITLSYTWDSDGVYSVKAKSKDVHEYESTWSQSVDITINWNQAFLFGKIKEKEENEETIEFKAATLLYISSNPSLDIRFYSSDESIVVSKENSGFIGKSFVLGNFQIGFIPS